MITDLYVNDRRVFLNGEPVSVEFDSLEDVAANIDAILEAAAEPPSEPVEPSKTTT